MDITQKNVKIENSLYKFLPTMQGAILYVHSQSKARPIKSVDVY